MDIFQNAISSLKSQIESKKDKVKIDLDKMREKSLLEKFIVEFFPINDLHKVGFFTPEMKGDFKAYEKRICEYFGLKTIYEYGAREIRCHISETEPNENTEFITTIPNIYE